jgi:two-component system chemotaxis response regulator CheY
MRDPSILIVDDVAVMRELLTAVLKPFGYEDFHYATSAQEAIDAYRSARHDLVFMDVDMPGKDGLDALREIKAINPDAYVIMVSAHGDADILALAIKLGANGYVVKDYKPATVAGMVGKFREHFAKL